MKMVQQRERQRRERRQWAGALCRLGVVMERVRDTPGTVGMKVELTNLSLSRLLLGLYRYPGTIPS